MAEEDKPPRVTEPDTIKARFATVVAIEVQENFVRLVFLDDHMVVGYDGPERRIVDRLALPIDVAHQLVRDLRRGLAKGGH